MNLVSSNLMLVAVAIGLASTAIVGSSAEASGPKSHVSTSAGDGPFTCDDGRMYEIIKERTLYIDGSKVRDGRWYAFNGNWPDPVVTLVVDDHIEAHCRRNQ